MTNLLRNLPMPSPDDLEIDKVPGAWVLTWWLPNGVTLRLKIRHSSSEEPDDCVAEVRQRPGEEFQRVREFTLSVYQLVHPEEFCDIWDVVPEVWTEEWVTLAKVWARLTYIAEFGATFAERHASEPHSSIDHFDSSRGGVRPVTPSSFDSVYHSKKTH
jgi:hypothetical protein